LKFGSLEPHISILAFAIVVCTTGIYLLIFCCSTHGMTTKLNAWARPIGFKWVATWIGVLFKQDMKLRQIGHNNTSCAQLLHIPLCQQDWNKWIKNKTQPFKNIT
jgi:hypothetical protein